MRLQDYNVIGKVYTTQGNIVTIKENQNDNSS